jgi:hypothetical protein
MWENRPYKSLMRTLATQPIGKAAKVYLTLPSDEIRDILEALKSGTINRKTFVIAVEKDPLKARRIEEQLGRLFQRFYVHVGQLYTLPLAEVLEGQQIDLAFFDLCGQLTSNVALWLAELSGREFVNGAVVSFTFNTVYRANLMMDAMKFSNGEAPRWEAIERMLSRCPQVSVKPVFDGGCNATLLQTLYAFYGAVASAYRFNFQRIHEYHDSRNPMVFIQVVFQGATSTAGNAISKYVRKVCYGLRPQYEEQREPKSEPAWKLLGCPARMTAGKKMSVTKQAKKGNRPDWISPQEWAWHPLNPKGHRAA